MTLQWKLVECPYCGALTGKRCRSATGRIINAYVHVERHQRADEYIHKAIYARIRPIRTVYLPGDAPTQWEKSK